MESKTYWENKIIEWENSIQGQGKVGFVEKVASHFRGPVKYRGELCIDILRPFVQGRSVLDLGCGSGFFAFELFRQTAPSHITGIDITAKAINRAQDHARPRNLADQFTFICGDVTSVVLPEVDVTVGLGFFDYLTLPEITAVFKNMKTKYFLFSFVENKISLMRYLHILYMSLQQCPKHFYYPKNKIMECISSSRYSDVKFFNHEKLSFACLVHNFPQTAELERVLGC